MAYNLGYKCVKNCCKRTILVQLIVKDVVTWFFWNTVQFGVHVSSALGSQQLLAASWSV